MDSGAGEGGAILRDSKGGFVAAAMEFKHHALDAATMEAFALLLGPEEVRTKRMISLRCLLRIKGISP